MSMIVSRNVDDLPEPSRQSIEQILGERLQAHQRVYIIVEAPLGGPSEEKRRHAARRVQDLMARAQAHADGRGVSDDQIDAAVEEAMTHARRRA